MKIAVAKGRIFEEVQPLLAKAGVILKSQELETRKIILSTEDANVHIVLIRSSDVPTYVASGAVDAGIVGRDVIAEQYFPDVCQPLDLKVACCRLVVAAPENFDYDAEMRSGARFKVATKYVNLTRNYFSKKGIHADLVKLYGSMELAPLIGLTDLIVDLSDSGRTLRENGLSVIEEIMPISAHFVFGRSSMRRKGEELRRLLARLKSVVIDES